MSRRKLTIVVLVLVVAGLSGPAPAPRPPEGQAEARLKIARDAFRALDALKAAGEAPGGDNAVYLWSRRLADAQYELATEKADKVAAVQGHVDRVKEMEKDTTDRFQRGAVNLLTLLDHQYCRVEAEEWLAKVKGE